MSVRKEDSALGVARARFVDGLPKKGGELKGALALLAATPDSERSREEMRRRMHALYASAQVFRIDALAEALKECIDLLDAARDQKRALVQDEIDRIAHVAATLPAMASASAERASEAPSPMTMTARPTRKPAATLQGLGLPRPMPSDLPPSSVAPSSAGWSARICPRWENRRARRPRCSSARAGRYPSRLRGQGWRASGRGWSGF